MRSYPFAPTHVPGAGPSTGSSRTCQTARRPSPAGREIKKDIAFVTDIADERRAALSSREPDDPLLSNGHSSCGRSTPPPTSNLTAVVLGKQLVALYKHLRIWSSLSRPRGFPAGGRQDPGAMLGPRSPRYPRHTEGSRHGRLSFVVTEILDREEADGLIRRR